MNTLQDKFMEHMGKFKQPIKVNGIDNIAFFREIDDKNSEDSKYMFTTLGVCNQGDLVEYDGYNWLILSQGQSYNGVYEKVIIKKCQYGINFIIKGILQSVPSIFESKTMDVTSGQYISLPTGTILVAIPLTAFTKTIDINSRFINTGRAWKVTGIDRTKDNLITLTCTIDAIAADDDLINEIPNKSAYTLAITNATSELSEGDTLQIAPEFKYGDTNMCNVTYSYSVDDTSIATISGTGLLSGIKEGTVNVTVKVSENQYYTTTKVFIVNAVSIAPLYTVTPTDREILQGETTVFTCNKTVNGVTTSTTWSIQNITGTTVPTSGYYTFTVTGTNTFSITNIKRYTGGNVTVRCTDTENTDALNNYIDVVITLGGAW